MAILNDINFNQDYSCLVTTMKQGFKIYATDPFASCFTMEGPDRVSLVTMLYCTSLVVATGSKKNNVFNDNMLKVLNTKKNSAICELTFPESIVSIALNKKCMMVALSNTIHLYDISTMNEISKLTMYASPRKTMTALSTSTEDNSYYVVSVAEDNPNHIQMYDITKKEFLGTISAHKSPVVALNISNDGKYIATVSKKGTVIRVFSTQTGLLHYEFRRGFFKANITQLSFDPTDSYLTVASDRKSVHVFNLVEDNLLNHQRTCYGIPLSQCCKPVRSYILANTSCTDSTKIASVFPKNNRILVATNKGNVYNFDSNFQTGGDASLYSHSMLESNPE